MRYNATERQWRALESVHAESFEAVERMVYRKAARASQERRDSRSPHRILFRSDVDRMRIQRNNKMIRRAEKRPDLLTPYEKRWLGVKEGN